MEQQPSALPVSGPHASQQGSIAVMMAGMLLLGLILLGSIQIGYTAYVKRELQKTADAAALSAVQVLGNGSSQECEAARHAADVNARQNYPGLASVEVERTCGYWDGTQESFVAAEAANGKYEAVQVVINHASSSIVPFTPGSDITVDAVASVEAEPVAVFSIGPSLIQFNNDSVVGGLLHTLGLDVDSLAVLSKDGVLDAKFTMGGLLKALELELDEVNVGSMNNLLDTEVGLAGVLNAALRAANQDETLYADVVADLVGSVRTQLQLDALSDVMIPLGGEEGGLFGKIETQSAAGALNAELTLQDVISTALAVATTKNAVDLNISNVNLGFLQATAQAGIVNPPSIAIGGVGTKALSAQARTYAHVKLDTEEIPLLGSLLRLKLDLPIVLDAVRGQATFLDAHCDGPTPRQAEIGVKTALLDVCIGEHSDLFSTSEQCKVGLQPKELLDINLLGTSLARLDTSLAFTLLEDGNSPSFGLPPEDGYTHNETSWFYEDEKKTIPEDGSSLKIGDAVPELMNALLASLVVGSVNRDADQTEADPEKIAKEFWDEAADSSCSVEPANSRRAYECRKARLERASESMRGGLHGLQGLLGSVAGGTLELLDSLVTLDIIGVLGRVNNVLETTLSSVGQLLGNLLGGLLGENDSCAGRGQCFGLIGRLCHRLRKEELHTFQTGVCPHDKPACLIQPQLRCISSTSLQSFNPLQADIISKRSGCQTATQSQA